MKISEIFRILEERSIDEQRLGGRFLFYLCEEVAFAWERGLITLEQREEVLARIKSIFKIRGGESAGSAILDRHVGYSKSTKEVNAYMINEFTPVARIYAMKYLAEEYEEKGL